MNNQLDIDKTPTILSKFKALFNWVNWAVTYSTPVTLTDGATITLNSSESYNFKITLEGSRTLAITNLVAGAYGTIEVVQGGSGSYTLTLPSNSKVSGGGSGAVTLSTTVGAIDIIAFYYNGTTLYWNVQTNFT